MVIEGYIGKRTPPLLPDSLFDISLPQNIKTFIYEKIVDARRGTKFREQLLDFILGDEKLNVSLPLRFSELRDWLDEEIENYDFVLNAYQASYDGKLDEAQACGPIINLLCRPIYDEAALILGVKQLYN